MVCILVSIYFNSPDLAYNKNKLCQTLDYWSRDMVNFDFLEKGLGIVFPPSCVYVFSRKMFLMLYSIIWPNFIVWYPLLQDGQYIYFNCLFPRLWLQKNCNLTWSFCMTKKLRRNFKRHENRNSFSGEIKRIFHHF